MINKTNYLILGVVFLTFFASCNKSNDNSKQKGPVTYQDAVEYAHHNIIFAGHIDMPHTVLKQTHVNISKETMDNFDYPKAKKGGLNAAFMSIFIPDSYQKEGSAKALADSEITLVKNLVRQYPDKFALATSPADVKKQFKQGLVSLGLGIENGITLEGNLSNIKYFYDQGVRYITLSHTKNNAICGAAYDSVETGLTDFGVQVVKKMNQLGMIVDISHVSDSSFYDVLKVTKAPVIASHSSPRHFTPGWERNMSDDMMKKLAGNGGVMMISFGTMFLTNKNRESGKNDFMGTLDRVADQIDYAVKLIGINHVGIGTDYDGVANMLPPKLSDVSKMPNLIYELMKRGYTKEELQKLTYKNIFRVWNKVHAIGEKL